MSNIHLIIYNQLIYKRKVIQPLKKSKEHYGEYENHHIIPRACGGLDNKENIVCLTIREHYIAHLLLSFIYQNTQYEKQMLNAISYMKYGSLKSKRSTCKINSKLYHKLVSKARKTYKLHPSYKGYINITDGIHNKFIPPNQLTIYLNNGWKRGQKQNITENGRKRKGDKFRNTYFVTNGVNNLRIPNDQPIPIGYYKGRVFNCKHLSEKPTTKNHKWMHNGNKMIHVPKSQIQKYINMGYQLGRDNINAFKFSTKGKIAINNGNQNKMIFPNELNQWEKLGWKKGLLKKIKLA